MIKEANQIFKEIDEVLEKYDWVMVRSGQYAPGRYELWIRPKQKEDSPPPLGVHVIDGAGGKDIPR